MHTSRTVALFALLIVSSAVQGCLYNGTHCGCSLVDEPGICLRYASGTESAASCTADACKPGGYKCDCFGAAVCKLDSCAVWKPRDGIVTGKDVPCKKESDSQCVTMAVPPQEFRMVQLGEVARKPYMFNMTWQVDEDDTIVQRFNGGQGRSMHDRWPMHDTLRARQINMRLYHSEDESTHFVCAIINTYNVGNDGLPNYGVKSTIKSTSGKPISFMACDDWNGASQSGECKAPLTGPELTASHKGISKHTDGWCVGPLNHDTEGVTIELTEVDNFSGINFLGGDTISELTFQNGQAAGLSGDVDTTTGLVTGGVVPKITIMPSGILVP